MTGQPPVLVVTRLDDATADVVTTELHRRAIPVVRLDPGDFPADVALSARLGDAGLTGALRTASRNMSLSQVRAVYWRRPTPYSAPPLLTEQDARWCVEQARYGLGGVLAAFAGAYYVNHPWRNRDAEYKPAQLATAERCGLRIPQTLITNDLVVARRFVEEYGPVVYKPLRNVDHVDKNGRALTVWVEVVDPASLDAGVAQSAHLFQQRINAVADLRLTAVADDLFTVRIEGAPGMDWRRHYDSLHYTLIDTPPELVRGVRAYLEAFGLVFGAFDFGLDADGRAWLYECNPNGQWAWFPDPITSRIAAALADRLQDAGGPP
ncbi:ATP-grasp ribosomal peptide maturase [Streptomyces sp. NPDC052496]|uniref:ATP-grasp ribosomal peptide maturase n=1 Tax=Streptomyces sp. NPDC052496 TaxID=3154951 RepID=UPI00341C988F